MMTSLELCWSLQRDGVGEPCRGRTYGNRGASRLRRGTPSIGGVGGPSRGRTYGNRGASRLRRGVPSVGGYGGPFRGPPLYGRLPDQRRAAHVARLVGGERAPAVHDLPVVPHDEVV